MPHRALWQEGTPGPAVPGVIQAVRRSQLRGIEQFVAHPSPWAVGVDQCGAGSGGFCGPLEDPPNAKWRFAALEEEHVAVSRGAMTSLMEGLTSSQTLLLPRTVARSFLEELHHETEFLLRLAL